jgi:hypothetical protein
MIGGDGGDRLADVAHHVGGEHRLVVADQAVLHAGHVVGGDHRFDAVDLPGGADVDGHDACVRVRRPQRGAPQAAVGGQVGGELEAALHLGDAVGTRRRRADRARHAPDVGSSRALDDAHDASPGGAVDRDLLHGVDDPAVAGAAADVARRVPRGSRCRSVRDPLEQVVDRHDQPRGAEPALHGTGGRRTPLHVARRVGRGDASMVTIGWPTAEAAITRHEHTSTPSTSTLHEPHSPCSHAPFAPSRPSRSRRTSSRLSPSHESAPRVRLR